MNRGVCIFNAIIVLLLFTAACRSTVKKEEFQFYYYPEKNVYYDPVKKDFWYSLNGTRSWIKFTDTNSFNPAALGEKVVVHSSTANVYKDNQSHRKLYAGKLYSINIYDTTLSISKNTEVMERPPVQRKKSIAVKMPENNKPKNNNGISKFINKIFGKHQ